MLSIEDLWVSIDGREVLRGVNMRIPVGATHILFGKNGSGKSTLLGTIMGFGRYRVEQGRITFRGREVEPGEYEAVGPRLNLSANAIAAQVRRLRLRCRELALEEVAHTVMTLAEAEDELRQLFH